MPEKTEELLELLEDFKRDHDLNDAKLVVHLLFAYNAYRGLCAVLTPGAFPRPS